MFLFCVDQSHIPRVVSRRKSTRACTSTQNNTAAVITAVNNNNNSNESSNYCKDSREILNTNGFSNFSKLTFWYLNGLILKVCM